MVLSTWWSWLLVLVVLAVVAMILFARRRNAGEPREPKDPEALAGGTMVRATRRIAWLYVAACTLGGLVSTAETLWGEAARGRVLASAAGIRDHPDAPGCR